MKKRPVKIFVIVLISAIVLATNSLPNNGRLFADERLEMQNAVTRWWEAATHSALQTDSPLHLLSPIEDVITLYPGSNSEKAKFARRTATDLNRLAQRPRGEHALDDQTRRALQLLEFQCRRYEHSLAQATSATPKDWIDRESTVLQKAVAVTDPVGAQDAEILLALAAHRSARTLTSRKHVVRQLQTREQLAKKQFTANTIGLVDYLKVQADLLFVEYTELENSRKKAGQVATAYGHLLQTRRNDAERNPIPADSRYCRASLRRLNALSATKPGNISEIVEETNYVALTRCLEWSQANSADAAQRLLYGVFRIDAVNRLTARKAILATTLENHESFRTRQQAAMSLAWLLEIGTPVLIEAMDHEDIETQKFVRHLVGRQGAAALTALHQAAATHPNEQIRHNALLAIGYIGPTSDGLQELRKLLANEDDAKGVASEKSPLVQSAIQGVLDAQRQFVKPPQPRGPQLPGIWSPKLFR